MSDSKVSSSPLIIINHKRSLYRKWSFLLRISSVNVTKSAADLVTFTEEILNGKLRFFVQWMLIDLLWSGFQEDFDHSGTCKPNNVLNVSKYGAFFGSCFPVFSPNAGKYGPEATPYLDTFHAVQSRAKKKIK